MAARLDTRTSIILALIVFSLTFPGAIYSAANWLNLAREVLVNWFIVLLILLFFGYASGYLSIFPSQVVLAWSVAVPALLFSLMSDFSKLPPVDARLLIAFFGSAS
jgi:hypothetical protein